MYFIRVNQEGTQTLVNLDSIVSVAFDETKRHLQISLNNTKIMQVTGDEAFNIWHILSQEFELRIGTDEEVETIDDRGTDLNGYVYGSEIRNQTQDLSEVENRISDLERRVQAKQVYNRFEGTSLLFELERMRVPRKDKDIFQSLMERARKVAREVEEVADLNRIEHSLSVTYTTILSARKVVNDLTLASQILRSKGKLTPELEKKIRAGKERAALFRTIKKLKEAEVIANENKPKHEKLIKEADVLLKQDWAEFFPGETPPDLSSIQKI